MWFKNKKFRKKKFIGIFIWKKFWKIFKGFFNKLFLFLGFSPFIFFDEKKKNLNFILKNCQKVILIRFGIFLKEMKKLKNWNYFWKLIYIILLKLNIFKNSKKFVFF